MKVFAIIAGLFFLAASFLRPASPWWLVSCLFSVYTCFCSFRDYYNPMLLGILCLGYLISLAGFFPGFQLDVWIDSSTTSLWSVLPFSFRESSYDALLASLAALVNFRWMQVGLVRAKLPGYNKDFSYSERHQKQADVG